MIPFHHTPSGAGMRQILLALNKLIWLIDGRIELDELKLLSFVHFVAFSLKTIRARLLVGRYHPNPVAVAFFGHECQLVLYKINCGVHVCFLLPPQALAEDQQRKTYVYEAWWAGKDSNLGRQMPTDLQSALVDRLSTYPCFRYLCNTALILG